MRRAKIAGTLGPACESERDLERMAHAGLDIARLNFSHGTIDEHRRRVRTLRRVSRRVGRNVSLLADLQGPRFRVGTLDAGSIELLEGRSVDLLAGARRGPSGTVPVTYAALARDVQRGDRVLLDDGKIDLRVDRIRDSVVRCTVSSGGVLTDGKGINLPGSRLSVPTLTAKDRADLRHAVSIGADWLAISFVRGPEDILRARRLLERAGSDIPVMAKIERGEAVDRLDEILEAADGLLVARGDLGVELPPERVPVLQKEIIDAANRAGKPVMTATQMLESMRRSRRPTRAEATDVANAVLDGSGSLLLTAETAVGRYPAESVAMMAAIIGQAEQSGRAGAAPRPSAPLSVPLACCRAACSAASDVNARALVVFTHSGFTARQTARFRPATPIVAYTPSASIARRINLYWGVDARPLRRMRSVEQLMTAVDAALLEQRLVEAGETVVVLFGAPLGLATTTNLMQLHQVGSRGGATGRKR